MRTSSGLENLGDSLDFYSASEDLLNGDVEEAAKGFASMAGGALAGAVCEAATAPETASLSTAGCIGFEFLASVSVEDALSG